MNANAPAAVGRHNGNTRAAAARLMYFLIGAPAGNECRFVTACPGTIQRYTRRANSGHIRGSFCPLISSETEVTRSKCDGASDGM
jgi:hypothetical protein